MPQRLAALAGGAGAGLRRLGERGRPPGRAAAWPEPSSRRCAHLLATTPNELDAQGKFLAHLAAAAPDLARAGELASGFAALIRAAPDKEAGPALTAWLADAGGTALDAFARGITRGHDAVLAALVDPRSAGPVEGRINRPRLLKRTMHGRASYDLLRRRVLAAA